MTDYPIHDSLPSGFSFADRMQTEAFERSGSVRGAHKVCLVRADEETIHNEAEVLQALDPHGTSTEPFIEAAVRATAGLAVRLGPPKTWRDIDRALIRTSAEELGIYDYDQRRLWYIDQYNAGWKSGSRGGDSAAWNSGMTNHAWDDGYLDAVAGRPKWHLAFCADHDNCGEG